MEYYKNYHGLLFKETDLIKIEVGQSYRVKVKLKNGVQIISEYETILQTPDDEVELNFQADTSEYSQKKIKICVREEK